jgi:hypothetical protein
MSMSLHCILLTGIWTLKTIRGNVLHDLPSQTLNTSYVNDRISNDDLIRPYMRSKADSHQPWYRYLFSVTMSSWSDSIVHFANSHQNQNLTLAKSCAINQVVHLGFCMTVPNSNWGGVHLR